MSRLSQHGGFDEDALKKAKEAMAEGLDFAEQQEPLARNQSGYPSLGNFTEQHFDFKVCQRSNGSFYGVPQSSSCSMKGAKEVKPKDEKKALQKNAKEYKNANAHGMQVLSSLASAVPGLGGALSMYLKAANALSDKDAIANAAAKKELEAAKKEAVNNVIKAAKAEKKARAEKKAKAENKTTNALAKAVNSKSVSPSQDLAASPKPQKSKAEPKRVIELTRNASQSEVLSEWRGAYAYQRERGESREWATKMATQAIMRDGFDPRKLKGVIDVGIDLNNYDFR